jgi:hypothetical protein
VWDTEDSILLSMSSSSDLKEFAQLSFADKKIVIVQLSNTLAPHDDTGVYAHIASVLPALSESSLEVSVLNNIFASITAARSLDNENSEQIAMGELGKVASFLQTLAERERLERAEEAREANILLVI